MKKLFFLMAMLIAVQFSYAQWTTSSGSTTTTDNVGVGTTSPELGFKLDVNGFGTIGTQGNARVYMGTTDATHSFIQSRDNSVNQSLTFDASAYNFAIGNVGIGTTTPHALLQVNGSYGAYTSDFGILSITPSSDESRSLSLGYDQSLGTNGSGWIQSIKSGVAYTPLLLNPISGNIGIGTTNPLNKLDVQGGNASIYNTNTATTLAIGSNATGKTVLSLSTSADANGYGEISSVSASGSTYGNTAINPSGGNVAIGTTDPQGHKLAVNGDIIATKITVKSYGNWPDYVFKPQYKLPSLSEVKTYIDQNQHLPDMPSEQEINKDGVDLGEIVKLQTKKIEELTLYLIQLKEENESFKSQLKEINNKLNPNANQ
jgi:hypothetical protein